VKPIATDHSQVYKLEEYLPESLRTWARAKLGELRVMLIDNGILAAPESAGSESQSLVDARSRVDSFKNERNTHKADLETAEADLAKSYGPDDIFLALKGQCVNSDSGEYTYEHCWLDRTTQKPKKGGMDTNMGYFTTIEYITVDEEEPADGKGLGSGERIAIKYENGAHCWNGPARTTTVILGCSEKNEVWKIIEEEKCIYRMEAGSPAACTPPQAGGKGEKPAGKDEL
jgi:protein kinase C substrate 80K-H